MGNCQLSTDIFSAEISRMNRNRLIRYYIIAAFVFTIISGLTAAQSLAGGPENDRMPITTNSPEARALFEQGVVEWENLHISRALEHWQGALEKDPNFLLAHLYIS